MTPRCTLLLVLVLGACAAPERPPAPTGESAAGPAPPAPEPELSMDPLEVAFRQEASAARRLGLPVLIQERRYEDDVFTLNFYNVSERPFETVALELAPYNAAGRLAGPRQTVRFGGPVQPSFSLMNGLLEGRESGVWAAEGITCVEITGLAITFADGERKRYNFDTVTRMYRNDVDKWCRFGS